MFSRLSLPLWPLLLWLGLLPTMIGFGQDFSKSERMPLPSEVEQFRFWGAIGATAGIAIPLNDLGDSDVFNENSGYAQTGFSLNAVNVHYRFWKYYSFGVNWSRATLPYNMDALTRGFTANIQGLEFTGSVEDPWKIDNIAFGLVASMPTDDFDLDVKFMLAAVRSVVPEQDLNVFQQGVPTYTITQLEAVSLDMGYSLGVTGRVHVYRGLDWYLQAEYFSAKPEFDFDLVYSFGGRGESRETLPVYVLSLNTGVGLRF